MNTETPRLLLVPLTPEVIGARLRQERFTAAVPTSRGPLAVTYPPDWPGDILPLFSVWQRDFPQGEAQRHLTLVERATATAIGQMGTKGLPDKRGDVEIGYGLNPGARGQGYATEAVSALVADLLAYPAVRRVTAQTAVTNTASARVLQKLDFTQVGAAWDEEDGDLQVWARTR
ncbi:GNAT family N-acetyltransferase [Deinococcus hopiensis]|uniref:Protein N-acetyltransferase, RimJ/RimL family n=1 Tax=Deinococcus hopiensis KR-140 TaxID=695939 RepID=A0A1W1VQL7_9DEIO|nr:GNAT family N-acetyltransferase [Deinococcus hopiensis]SMB95648.1 Protein N-acetyltransferase, RimJ/RimL family [Deinococcus hopiensis KR-140]